MPTLLPALLFCWAAAGGSAGQARHPGRAPHPVRAAAGDRQSHTAANAMALSEQARDSARQVRATETQAVETDARIERLTARTLVLQASLTRDAAALAPMLPLIERLSLYPMETLLAQPVPAADALGGLMVLRGLARGIEARAEAIRTQQHELARLAEALRAEGRGRAALRQQQAARDRIVEAAARSAAGAQAPLSARDKASLAAASASRAATLVGALALTDRSPRTTAGGPVNPADMAGGAPVAGRLVEAWGDVTDAGPATGIRYAPPAMAVVVAPCAGRIDFAGDFRSYGRMLILDCGHGFRFVLAGLALLDVTVGQDLVKGAPVGRMADWGSAGRPSLYVQLRHGSEAIDPTGFLRGRS